MSLICEESLMDESLYMSRTTWSFFHEKPVKFAGKGRPGLQCIYFHFAIAMLKQKRRNPATAGKLFTKYAQKFAHAVTLASPDADEWYNKTLLRHLAKSMGGDEDLSSVLFSFAKEQDVPEDVDVEAHAAKLAAAIGGCTDETVGDKFAADDDEDGTW